MVRSLPSWKRTFEFVKRLSEHYSFGKIAAVSGKRMEVAEAWGRPMECDEYPSGTGKKDPSQTVLRLIGLAHEKDPGLAREWAATFLEYVDFLDEKEGRAAVDNFCAKLAKLIQEHTDVIIECTKSHDPDWVKVFSETKQLQAEINQFLACVKEQLKVKR